MAYEWTEARLKIWEKTLKLYDIEPKELNALRTRLLVAQGFKCGVCGSEIGNGRIAYMDHDHHSGAIRGMLCMNCNRFKVARNSVQSSTEVVRYLNDPPAHRLLESWGVRAHAGARARARRGTGGTVYIGAISD